jgi:hypothetical protein
MPLIERSSINPSRFISLLGDEAQVEARFGPFGDSATLDARLEHGLRRTYRSLGNSIGRTRWNF